MKESPPSFTKGVKSSPVIFCGGALVATFCLATSGFCVASPADDKSLASANNDFAFKLLKQLTKDQPGTNIFISPYSALAVMRMLCNGAGGQTRVEMQQVLGTGGLQPDALNEAHRAIEKSLISGNTNVILTTANAIWYRKGTPLKPDFVACNQRFFGTTLEAIDFNDPRSPDVMNAWVSEKTHGRMNRIADGLTGPVVELVLANAIYFKGKWEVPFEVINTKERVFHLRGGRQKKLRMMAQVRHFEYRRGTGYQAVRLAYQGWNLGMYIFLPDVNSGPDKLLGIMNGDTWPRVTKPGFSEREGTVVLPRFKLEYNTELKQPLKSLGMKAAFVKADFSGMSHQPLFVSGVRQGTFVEVTEEGTEAAAATMMAIPMGIEMNPPKPFEMIVDRPFLFLIEDRQTGTILFMGIVFDPQVA